MLKTSAAAAVVLMLGLPLCAFARTDAKSHPIPEGYSERLPFTRTSDNNDSDCNGLSVKDFVDQMKRAPGRFGLDGEFNKQSVDEFMKGKKNSLRGVDAIPTNMKAPLPPAWGGDEFVKSEGFTQSGQPYQQVNPLYGIEPPKFDDQHLKFEKWNQPQR